LQIDLFVQPAMILIIQGAENLPNGKYNTYIEALKSRCFMSALIHSLKGIAFSRGGV